MIYKHLVRGAYKKLSDLERYVCYHLLRFCSSNGAECAECGCRPGGWRRSALSRKEISFALANGHWLSPYIGNLSGIQALNMSKLLIGGEGRKGV